MAIRIFHVDHDFVEVPLGDGGPQARVVVWSGTGARLASFHYVSYEPGQSSVPHAHPASEDVFYIVEGEGSLVELRDGRDVAEHPVVPGSVVYVEPGTVHQVRARTRLVNVGGPCPPDEAFYRRLGLTW
jgi:quercetin dioxygenase-like cupin family protein